MISARGARRWKDGHPWIFRSDVVTPPDRAAGGVEVVDQAGRAIGGALWSPASEISLRYVAPAGTALDAAWWRARLAAAIARRAHAESALQSALASSRARRR